MMPCHWCKACGNCTACDNIGTLWAILSVSERIQTSMYTVETTAVFDAWIDRLDAYTAARLTARITKLAAGLWGDCKPAGAGITELREHFGAGYRIYVIQQGAALILALGGGDKSTQQKDIAAAVALAKELRGKK